MNTIPSFTSRLLRHTRATNSIISSTENTPLLPLHNTSPPNSSNSLNEKTAYQTICSTTDECDINNQAKKPVDIKEGLFYFCLGFPAGVLISLVASGRIF